MTADVNFIGLIDRFADDDKCREYLEHIRWPNGEVACPQCGDMSVSAIRERDQWDCNSCHYQFSVTAGTIMHRSHLPLRKWFLAIYLMCESKKGMSANQLKRTLGVSYKTAWFLCHRIREAMGNDPFTGPTLFGIIEVDEKWIGGHQRGAGSGPYSTTNKAVVVGAVQRDGMVRLERIKDTRKATLHDFIRRAVTDEGQAIYTDEFLSYRGIGEVMNMPHATVNHGADEWVFGDVHTSSVEGVWSLFKRSIMGAFHKISLKHLDRYLEELEWRFNNRENPHVFRDTLRRIVDPDPLEYEVLTA
jgi:transposase-like protein